MSGPQNKHIRVENKNFYFDIKRNQQGRYMSISEVKGNYRNSILVPESGWENFRDVLDEYVKQVEDIFKKHILGCSVYYFLHFRLRTVTSDKLLMFKAMPSILHMFVSPLL